MPKETIRAWILEIDAKEKIPENIVALSFNLYEPYGLELVGSKRYCKDDEDWACEEDFVPERRDCPGFELPSVLGWEDVLDRVAHILKELSCELPDTQIFKVKHIALGFVDGCLVSIK
ncbi:MAG: hypothetical protein LBU11_02430 [Zoogloeaceae bacterium]|jgi:shikimate kinase|nr:hypothetical protein [Zoogloeaceae bacterium]